VASALYICKSIQIRRPRPPLPPPFPLFTIPPDLFDRQRKSNLPSKGKRRPRGLLLFTKCTRQISSEEEEGGEWVMEIRKVVERLREGSPDLFVCGCGTLTMLQFCRQVSVVVCPCRSAAAALVYFMMYWMCGVYVESSLQIIFKAKAVFKEVKLYLESYSNSCCAACNRAAACIL